MIDKAGWMNCLVVGWLVGYCVSPENGSWSTIGK